MGELQFLQEFAAFRRSENKNDKKKSTDELYEKYIKWCEKNNRPVIKKSDLNWFQARLEITSAFGLVDGTDSIGGPSVDQMSAPNRGSMRRS